MDYVIQVTDLVKSFGKETAKAMLTLGQFFSAVIV